MNLDNFLIICSLSLFALSCKQSPSDPPKQPNILFIAVDDLNDWIGVMGGHPQAKTPNMDRLASQGMLFTNAQCQSPVCNPSRASLMASRYPSSTGLYFLNPNLLKTDIPAENTFMPERFEEEGYHVSGVGKLFHNAGQQNETHIPNYGGAFGGFGPRPEEKISPYPGHPLWDWGAYPEHDSLMPDHKVANWAVEHMPQQSKQPWWMGVGFYRPHVPQYAPQKWFDLFPLESIQLPKTIEDDLEDISTYGIDITRLEHVSPDHQWILDNEEWKPLVQSYLACVSFVDAQVGKVLDALENNPAKDNTYIVLFSDHGFHIGEKERHAKRSLWEDGGKVPLIIAGPGIPKGTVCNKPVQLLDIYPTLLELAGMKADPLHEGNSMATLLKNPESEWPHYARTSFGPGNYAIVSERYRFIEYMDCSEEFYDHENDPHEWNNVIAKPEYEDIIAQHRAQVPKVWKPILGEGSTGHKSYEASKNAIKPN